MLPFRPAVAADDAFVDFLLAGLGDGAVSVLGPRGLIAVDPAKADQAAKARQARDQVLAGVGALRALGRQADADRIQEAAAVPPAVDPELKKAADDVVVAAPAE